jgi:hypothetical protein
MGKIWGKDPDNEQENTVDVRDATKRLLVESQSDVNSGTFDHNQKTVSGADAATVLQTRGVPNGHAVVVKAFSTNTDTIMVGDLDVTLTNGFELSASEAIRLWVTNVNKIYIRSASASQKVCWIVENDE